jgi:D-alanyl-D-alanine carboxypeptidase/D-alanyl-D-alanine-endopeptidase (penicillin-binding protein 4)
MRYLFWLVLTTVASSCSTNRLLKPIKNSEVFKQGFTGIVIYDPVKDKTLYAQNEDKYFTPASNTKLFTFYTAYRVLGDDVNSLNYKVVGDSLLFWGTGDPSFLHPDFHNSSVLELLTNSDKKLFWADNSGDIDANGPGWSWNWYKYYYGPQRYSFPMYGNIIRFSKDKNEGNLQFYPKYFSKDIKENINLTTSSYRIDREQDQNIFNYYMVSDTLQFETDKPFIVSSALTIKMLEDTLKREVIKIDYQLVNNKPHSKLKGIATDSLYKQMLSISDNFLAEQLLVLTSDKLFDSLNIEKTIAYSIDNYLNDLPDEPLWVDGSGLSAFNKFTPRSIIALLKKIKNEIPEEKIYAFFPAGGKSGTIKSWYPSDDNYPYIYAKTGTLNATHCLSGYLLTKSNKLLYFSFMHNNYIIGSDVLKEEMQRILYSIYKKY